MPDARAGDEDRGGEEASGIEEGRRRLITSLSLLLFTLVTGPSRSLSLTLSDTRVYEPQIRARLGTAAHYCASPDAGGEDLITREQVMKTEEPLLGIGSELCEFAGQWLRSGACRQQGARVRIATTPSIEPLAVDEDLGGEEARRGESSAGGGRGSEEGSYVRLIDLCITLESNARRERR